MLMNCPIFKAAPRILESLETNLLRFASVINMELFCPPSPFGPDERRISSVAAPKLKDAARPKKKELEYIIWTF